MKKLLSTNYSTGAFNAAILILRLGVGILMIHHGYLKLIDFKATASFMPDLGLGKSMSAVLIIFAEFFCSLFLILGLFTRLAAIPLIIAMSVVVFHITHADFFGKGESATLYLTCFITLLFIGPGRISVDSMIGK